MSQDESTLGEQLTQVLETYRSLQNLLIQVGAALVAADVILLGYGFSQSSSAPIWLAALLPLVGMVANQRSHRSALALAYFGYITEKRLISSGHGLVTTYLEVNSPDTVALIRQIVDQFPASEDQINEVRRQAKLREMLKRNPPTVIAITVAVQIALAIIVTFSFR